MALRLRLVALVVGALVSSAFGVLPSTARAQVGDPRCAYTPPPGLPNRIAQTKLQYPACPVTPPTDDAVEAADKIFAEASAAFARKEYYQAVLLWTKGYAFDCTRPAVLLDIGKAMERIANPYGVVAVYELFIERTGKTPDWPYDRIHELYRIIRENDAIEAAGLPGGAQVYAPPKGVPNRIAQTKLQYPACRQTLPTDDAVAAARKAHLEATEAFDAKDYHQALLLWSQAYSFDCTRPHVFLNLGQAMERVGNVHGAIAAYELFLERTQAGLPCQVDLEGLYVTARAQDAKEAADLPEAPEQPVPQSSRPPSEGPHAGCASCQLVAAHHLAGWINFLVAFSLIGLWGARRKITRK